MGVTAGNLRGRFRRALVLLVLIAGSLVPGSPAAADHSVTDLISVGGNGAFNAVFEYATPDGSRVFFETSEKLVAADTDSNRDVYERVGATTALVSTGPTGGNGAFDADFDEATTDGSRIFFRTAEPLVTADTDARTDNYERSGGSTTLVSAGAVNGNGAFDATLRAISADGTRVFFTSQEKLTADDADTRHDGFQRFNGSTTLITTGPADANTADSFIEQFGVSASGTRAVFHDSRTDGRTRHRLLNRRLFEKRDDDDTSLDGSLRRQRELRRRLPGRQRGHDAGFLQHR